MAGAQSNTRQELVRAEVVETAARVFAERGFRKATLEDVASRLGISRATLYHYVNGKEDLLRHVIGDVGERHATLLTEILRRDDLSPTAKLGEAIRTLIQVFGSNSDVMRVFLREEGELSSELLAEHKRWKDRSDEAMRGIVSEGIRAGEFRAVNPKLASFMIFGMVNWFHVWYRPDAELSLEEIADAFVEFAVAALAADGQVPSAQRSLDATIDLLRATIDDLDAKIRQLRESRRG